MIMAVKESQIYALFLVYIGLLPLAVVVSDFAQTIGDFEYIFHARSHLLLIVRDDSCYCYDVPEGSTVANQLGQLSTSLHQLIEQTILDARAGEVTPSSLEAMRSQYLDRLADFHCLDKQVFHLNLLRTPGQQTPEPCVDHVANGLSCADIPSVCTDQIASRMCRKFCNNCDGNNAVGTTEAPLLRGCVDDIGHGMTCDQVPGICNDVYGQLLCRHHCRLCTAEAGQVAPTSAPTHTPGECVDHVIGDLICSQLANICLDSLASRFCPHFCGYCNGQLTQNSCVDHVINGLHCREIPYICSTVYGHIVCKNFCKTCVGQDLHLPPTETPPEGSCHDNVGLGLSCDQLPEVCTDPTMVGPQLLCREYCGTCSNKPCINHVIHDFQCNAMPGVCFTAARHACPEFCLACNDTSYVPPPLQPSPSDPCYDRVGDGMTCADIPGVCDDQMGRLLLCRRFCGDCTTTTASHTLTTAGSSAVCADHTVPGITCTPEVCALSLAASFCARTCGLCASDARPTRLASHSDETRPLRNPHV